MQLSTNTAEISQGVDEALKACNSWYWAYRNQVLLASGPFTLDGHEFQVRPMSILPPMKVVCKATQLYFSVGEILSCLNGLIYNLFPQGVLYLFPTQDEVTDFSSSRWSPLINDNPDTIGQYVRDTNRANLKRIGQGFIFFRAGRLGKEIGGFMKTSSKLKSISADHVVHDEYDEMDPKIDEFVEGRLQDSKLKTKSYIGNPTLPDYGVDQKFKSSNQEYWHIKCQHCGHYTCLDLPEYWPDNGDGHALFHERADGSVIRACKNPRCQREIDPRFGVWVPTRGHIKNVIGFSIGRPSAYNTDIKKMLNDWRHPDTDKANFVRLRLGRAYIEAENRLSLKEVFDCCGTDGIVSSDPGPCFMGVDQGGSDQDLFHVGIGKKHPAKHGKIIYLSVEKGWSELDRFMKIFNVRRCVIDGLPNQDDARKFAYRWPGRVFLSYFNETQKGDYKWDEEAYIVNSNRTEAMDASHKEISNQLLILPRKCQIVEKYASHCHNTAKKLVEDEKTGSKRYVYIPKLGGPDHFRLAQCYETMARQGAPRKMFEDS